MIFGDYDYETDIRVQREEAKEEGIELGMVKGTEQTKIANAKRAIEKGLKLEDVAEITNLPLEQVQKLTEEVK